MANFLKLLFLSNDLVGRRYVEPYAGGASVALSLLYEEYASEVHINDIDGAVYAFWKVALTRTEELCERIEQTAVSVDEWTRQKAVQTQPDPDELDLAFSTFFLNRTNRSGIISGGIIGGKRQKGEWGIDARYNKQPLIQRIRKIGRYRSRILLTNVDAKDLLADYYSPKSDLFFYLDPPYYVKGQDLYQNYYRHEHHVEIAGLVRAVQQPWVVSYDAAPEILQLYSYAERRRYSLAYSAANKYAGSEVMFFSNRLTIPTTADSPAGISVDVVDSERRSRYVGT